MWIKIPRQHISPEATIKYFKKCCIPYAVDGTDDILQNDSEDGDSDTDW